MFLLGHDEADKRFVTNVADKPRLTSQAQSKTKLSLWINSGSST